MWFPRQRELGEGWSKRLDRRYKLEYMDWIDKFPLQSTEKYIQYPMINHNEKKFIWDFPGSPGLKTPHFYCKGCRFKPWSGN